MPFVSKSLKIALFSAALAASSCAASADVLTPNGVVLLNQGNGFQRIGGPTQVTQNDVIMVNDGTAQLTDGNGNSMTLTQGQLYTVGSPLPGGAIGGGAGGGMAGGGLAGGVAGGVGGLSTTGLIVGGVAVAGGAAAAAAASKGGGSNNNKPVSTSP